MSFDDLPENLRETPLDTTALRADAVDLFIGLRDRAADSLFIGFCDAEHRLIQPALVAGMPWRCEQGARRRALASVAEAAQQLGSPAVLVALASFSTITAPLAAKWRQAAVDEFGRRGIEVLGVYLATRDRVAEAPPTAGAA